MGDGYENGVHVQTVEPDIAGEIDERNGWQDGEPEECNLSIQEKASAIRWFCNKMWISETGERRKCKEAAQRFVAFTAVTQPGIFYGEQINYQVLAKELSGDWHCTRAQVCNVAHEFSDKAGIQFRGQRGPTTRKKNADARIKYHNKVRDHDRGLNVAFVGCFSVSFKRA